MTRSNQATTPHVLSADSLQGTHVKNARGDALGEIKALMIDLASGRVAYAVLAFGGFLGLGDKYFAVPWSAMALDTEDEKFILDVSKEQLQAAKGFDKNDWPDFADPTFHAATYRHYGQSPYWS
jgi:sporulation protein YlmC with PRC-barrel domain